MPLYIPMPNPPCRLYLFAAEHSAGATNPVSHDSTNWRLAQRAALDCSGIFDMRWRAPEGEPAVLAMALADGSVRMVQPNAERDGWQDVASAQVGDTMIMTVDWARHEAHPGRAVASTSAGGLAILQARAACLHCAFCRQILVFLLTGQTLRPAQAGESELEVLQTWHGHDLEAWTVAADCWQVPPAHTPMLPGVLFDAMLSLMLCSMSASLQK